MTAIKLNGLTELQARENLSVIPTIVQQHLDAGEKPQTEGQHFRIVRKHDMESVHNHGCAYFNELIVEKKTDGEWKKAYSTGRLKYRGAYADDVDDWSLNFIRVSILEESASHVTYGVTDGERGVTVYRFSESRPSVVTHFDLKGYQKTAERVKLLETVLKDPTQFRKYAENLPLGGKWGLYGEDPFAFDATGKAIDDVAQAHLIVLPLSHPDRDYDAIIDSYRIFVWLRGVGIGESGPLPSGLHHPGGRFYFVGLGFKAEVAMEKSRPQLKVVAYNNNQHWQNTHDFLLKP